MTKLTFLVSVDGDHIMYPATSRWSLEKLDDRYYRGSIIDEPTLIILRLATKGLFGRDDTYFRCGSFIYIDGKYDVYRLPLSVIDRTVKGATGCEDHRVRYVAKMKTNISALSLSYEVWRKYKLGNVKSICNELQSTLGTTTVQTINGALPTQKTKTQPIGV